MERSLFYSKQATTRQGFMVFTSNIFSHYAHFVKQQQEQKEHQQN